jgi:hypothetical protein
MTRAGIGRRHVVCYSTCMRLQSIVTRRLWCLLVALAVFAAGPGALFAQTAPPLADVAKKEQQRRKKVGSPAKVLTNKDLPKSAAPAQPAAPPTPPTPVAEGAAEPSEQQKPAGDEKDEAWWRTRITSAREALRRDEMFLEALQSRVNALSADFVNRDDPYQRARIGEDRQKALAEMDRVKAQIVATKKQIEDIEEEARKAGVPAGWLR